MNRVDRFFVRLAENPLKALAAFIAVQFLSWTLFPVIVSTAPRLDVVEGLVWGREWVIGTFKHPPLPAWMIEISLQATGSPIVGPIIAGQLLMALTYLFVFLAGRRLTTPRNALLGTLLLAGIVHFTWPTAELNHNLVQMPVWAGMIFALTVVRQDPAPALPWLALGLVAGIGIYAKYSVLVLYFVVGLWILYEPGLRRAVLTPWPWAGAALAIVVALPQIVWIVSSDFSQFAFAQHRGGDGSVFGALDWLATQAANHAPLLIFFAIVGYRRVWRLPKAGGNPNLAFVAWMALSPVLVTTLIAILTGQGLLDMWGMPMFTLSGLLIVLALDRQWSDYPTARTIATAMGFVFTVAVAYSISVAVSARTDRPQHAAWAMHAIAEAAGEAWSSKIEAPLKIISGNFWIAGLAANGMPARPAVVYNGRMALSPWLDEADFAKDGVLYLWEGNGTPDGLLPEDVPLEHGSVSLPGSPLRDRTLGYAVRLPAN